MQPRMLVSKARIPGLLVGEKCIILGSLVLMHYQRVIDGRTRRTESLTA